MNTDVMFSSKSHMWSTPQNLFDDLNQRFHFTIDVCATADNAKCKKYFSPEDNGLNQVWSGVCWCNPPYGREISKWVEKAFATVANNKNNTVVMLLPARTDTRWFHSYIYNNPNAKIEFIKGRLKFGNAKNSAPFPSMIVYFRKGINLK